MMLFLLAEYLVPYLYDHHCGIFKAMDKMTQFLPSTKMGIILISITRVL